MIGDLNRQEELALLNLLAAITEKGNLEDLLAYIVQYAPSLFKVRRCSIYLSPEFVPEYTGELIDDPKMVRVDAKTIKDEFIVLAQTNYPGKQEFIGKIFYTLGSDLTGWVFQTGRILLLKNARDLNELKRVDEQLNASVRYVSVEPETNLKDIFPILYCPLRIHGKTIGVLKLHQPNNLHGFSETDEQVGKIIAQIISGVIEKIQIVSNQNKKILSLAQLASGESPIVVYQNITKSMPEILDCSKAQIFLRTSVEDKVYLAYQNGENFVNEKIPIYPSGKGIIGWVFKTGLALNIDDLNNYVNPVVLSDEVLAKISDGVEVNDEDRKLEVFSENRDYLLSLKRKVPLIAVPIIGPDGLTQGVLCAHSLSRSRSISQRVHPFNDTDLQRLKTYASTISLAIHSEKKRRKGDLLLRLSQSENLSDLYKAITETLPVLLHDTDCFIYRLVKAVEPYLELQATNRDKSVLTTPTTYKIGEGKTGFCALSESILVFDHFGSGKINTRKIEAHKNKLRESRGNDLISDLFDENSNLVGTIRLQDGQNSSQEIKNMFLHLRELQIIQDEIGLPSEQMVAYQEMNSMPSHSFTGVPILLEKNKLEGIITVTRPIKGNPFLQSDIDFVQAVAKTIAQIIGFLELQEQRKKLYITLAHEINTYITPVLADAENLQKELSAIPDLNNMALHLFGQVQRLQLMSETILGVVSGKKTGERLTIHSIYRPLMDAISMFRDEASALGCDILIPKVSSDNRFPEIEMRLFELTLAFKNLIHNAIKYSFTPPIDQKRNRYVRITGKWCNTNRTQYCVSIENYGVGITEEEINKRLIFKEFYRGILSSDRQRTGSGIGLAYAAHVIEVMHHGSITAQSTPMGGNAYLTTFHITLPTHQSGSKWKR